MRLAGALADIEEAAKKLRWASERPWRVDSHVWVEGGVATIDLHDLNADLAKRIVALSADLGEELESGAVRFITGWGRHSVGLPVLPGVVQGALVRLEAERGWRMRMVGSGRYVLIVDETRAPRSALGGLDWGTRLFLAVFCLLAIWSFPPAGIVIAACLTVWFIAQRAKRGGPTESSD